MQGPILAMRAEESAQRQVKSVGAQLTVVAAREKQPKTHWGKDASRSGREVEDAVGEVDVAVVVWADDGDTARSRERRNVDCILNERLI